MNAATHTQDGAQAHTSTEKESRAEIPSEKCWTANPAYLCRLNLKGYLPPQH
jgi:hypothetical protein